MSDSVRPDRAAFVELERLVRILGEELAFFRRRALDAERRVRDLLGEGEPHAPGAMSAEAMRTRVADLERENHDLRARLDEAASRTRQMADRVRFIRQQQEPDDGR